MHIVFFGDNLSERSTPNSEKNKKNISTNHLLKCLSSMLSVKMQPPTCEHIDLLSSENLDEYVGSSSFTRRSTSSLFTFSFRALNGACNGRNILSPCLMTHQPLWVILCSEKWRKQTEELVDRLRVLVRFYVTLTLVLLNKLRWHAYF